MVKCVANGFIIWEKVNMSDTSDISNVSDNGSDINRALPIVIDVPEGDDNGGMEMFEVENDAAGVAKNPFGSSKEGWRWSDVMREVADMFPDDLIALLGEQSKWGEILANKPKKVRMRYLVAAVAFAALSEFPSPALMNAVIERTDGKMPTVVKSSDGSLMEIEVRRVAVNTDEL